MLPQESSSDKLLKRLLHRYYSLRPLAEPVYLPKREIAVYSLEDKVYIRHLSFPSMTMLYKYILEEKTPLHLYYSSAYYEDPSAETMESKNWLGSDLIFDIDADHYPGCGSILSICTSTGEVVEDKIKKCRDDTTPVHYQLISFDCIKRGWRDARTLVSILWDDLGYHDIEILYSGNRGFHIHVLDDDAKKLDREERRQIVEYIMLKGIDVEKIFPPIGKRNYVYFTDYEVGWRKRVFEELRARNLITSSMKMYRARLDDVVAVLGELSLNIDPVVTMDTSRLSRFTYSINGKSGLTVTPMKIDANLDEYSYLDFSPWEGSISVKPLITISGLPVLDKKIDLKKGVNIKMDATRGLYLALKGLVVINEIEGVEVKNV